MSARRPSHLTLVQGARPADAPPARAVRLPQPDGNMRIVPEDSPAAAEALADPEQLALLGEMWAAEHAAAADQLARALAKAWNVR